jgi:hypothetical protein
MVLAGCGNRERIGACPVFRVQGMSIVTDFESINIKLNRMEQRRDAVLSWTDAQKSEWLNARNWEEICHKPHGSFRDAGASKPQA